jgi:molybdate transport system substrate-binding protein
VRRLGLAIAATVALLAGCGSDDGNGKPQLTVFAATSLKNAFQVYGDSFGAAKVRFSFAGSDELAAQIREGSAPDVYAAANTKLPLQLFAKKLVERPVVFAANRLVLAVPAGTTKVRSVNDVAKPGVTLAVGSASVPVGAYTRQVLTRLGPSESKAILRNVKSEEPDVSGVVGKLTQGAVDAGFVYITDVEATKGTLKAIELPARLQPAVQYGAAVVTGASHPNEAREFIDGLLTGAGRNDLLAAGFTAPR